MAVPSPPLPHAIAPSRPRNAPLRAVEQPPRLDLDPVAYRWQHALDAAQRALNAQTHVLPGAELRVRSAQLAQERQGTARTLAQLARVAGVAAPWLSPAPVTAKMLGLPESTSGCLFDLDGVLTDSGELHARAWAQVFDDLLLRVSERAGWHLIRFDRDADYRAYLQGRPRLEGIHAFLASRGIHLPEGRRSDPADAETTYGLARAKSEALARAIRHGVTALDGAHRYLQAAGYAGIARAVLSASASTTTLLELAGLTSVVDAYLDADAIRAAELRSPPAPDVLLEACRRLGVEPEHVVAFTSNPVGVAAGRAAGLTVVGVAVDDVGELLSDYGADRVVSSLTELLDRRLAVGA